MPAAALQKLVSEAAESGGCVDVARRLPSGARLARSSGGVGVRCGDPRGHPGLRGDRRTTGSVASGPDRCCATNLVVSRGLCLWGLWPAQEPDWTSDRELAADRAQDARSLRSASSRELRTAGASTTGVWGAMPEDDRRALHRIWRQRRQQQDPSEHRDGRAETLTGITTLPRRSSSPCSAVPVIVVMMRRSGTRRARRAAAAAHAASRVISPAGQARSRWE